MSGIFSKCLTVYQSQRKCSGAIFGMYRSVKCFTMNLGRAKQRSITTSSIMYSLMGFFARIFFSKTVFYGMA